MKKKRLNERKEIRNKLTTFKINFKLWKHMGGKYENFVGGCC